MKQDHKKKDNRLAQIYNVSQLAGEKASYESPESGSVEIWDKILLLLLDQEGYLLNDIVGLLNSCSQSARLQAQEMAHYLGDKI